MHFLFFYEKYYLIAGNKTDKPAENMLHRRRTLQRYSEVIGKEVVCLPDGKKIGEVKELIFLAGKPEFMGIIFGQGRFEIRKRAVARDDILSIDKQVIVRDSKCARKISEVCNGDAADNISISQVNLKGLRVFTRKGSEIGYIEDVLFDYRTGRIECLELSDGFLQDFIDGRKLMPLIGKVEFAEEHLLVSREAVEEMKESGGGIRKYFEKEWET
jgi:uncharacterized protein YrrD